MFDFKNGPFSLLKEFLPKEEGQESPFQTPDVDDEKQDGCIEGCLSQLMSLGVMGCLLLSVLIVGIVTTLFGCQEDADAKVPEINHSLSKN